MCKNNCLVGVFWIPKARGNGRGIWKLIYSTGENQRSYYPDKLLLPLSSGPLLSLSLLRIFSLSVWLALPFSLTETVTIYFIFLSLSRFLCRFLSYFISSALSLSLSLSQIVDVNLVRDKATGKSKGFAFVAYEDQRSTRCLRLDIVLNFSSKELVGQNSCSHHKHTNYTISGVKRKRKSVSDLEEKNT